MREPGASFLLCSIKLFLLIADTCAFGETQANKQNKGTSGQLQHAAHSKQNKNKKARIGEAHVDFPTNDEVRIHARRPQTEIERDRLERGGGRVRTATVFASATPTGAPASPLPRSFSLLPARSVTPVVESSLVVAGARPKCVAAAVPPSLRLLAAR